MKKLMSRIHVLMPLKAHTVSTPRWLPATTHERQPGLRCIEFHGWRNEAAKPWIACLALHLLHVVEHHHRRPWNKQHSSNKQKCALLLVLIVFIPAPVI